MNHTLTQTQPNSDHRQHNKITRAELQQFFQTWAEEWRKRQTSLRHELTNHQSEGDKKKNNESGDRHKREETPVGSKSFIRLKKKKCYSLYINN